MRNETSNSTPQNSLEIRLDKSTIHRVDAYATDRGMTFNEALQELLLKVLEDKELLSKVVESVKSDQH
jgi:antitoxin component of RelBE/YafQ-DinJ toxin-antitoxin module